MNKTSLTQYIKEAVAAAGFDACGTAPVAPLTAETAQLRQWLADGRHAGMTYMERYTDRRENPALLLDGARSVVVMLYSYKPPATQPPDAPKIAYYAYGRDYHDVIRHKLKTVIASVAAACPEVRLRGFVDSAPVLEKAWAVRAGLGWIGKNCLLVSPRFGSFTFIAELLVTAELDYNTPTAASRCGSCRRCLDACPGGALDAYRIDANRCISYHNKRKGNNGIDIGRYCFGCDCCQLACPWNFAAPTHRHAGWTIPEIVRFSAADWQGLDEAAFNRIFAQSALRETGFSKLQSNWNTCLGKQPSTSRRCPGN
ncbi:MAG: tRNA epoxyqueuosine(34) reductase QueG [Prevotellaceae bacterium]|jgi:epoxyqueuosine reductase|nr:tRNA epoxyqueuosine(34) reductase QueG [Prevotellaceae bacterium]